jgi:hypothetical protein
MSFESWAVRVENRTSGLCLLSPYPTVRLRHRSASRGSFTVRFLSEPYGRPLPTMPPTSLLVLGAGQTATALLEGQELPRRRASACRPVVVSIVPREPLTPPPSASVEFCQRDIDVAPFVLGFDGQATDGEIVGTAPECRPTTRDGPAGPVVQVDAWRGRTLATFVLQFARPTATTRYHMVLPAGRYRVTARGEPSRLISVRAGFPTGLSAYGRCSVVPTTVETIPPAGRVGATTSTTAETAATS